MVDLSKVTKAADWPKQRQEIETVVREWLGPLPETRVEPQIKVMDEQSGPGYTRRRINYFVDEWQRISAWLFVPEARDEERPGILCCHRAVNQGKDEAAGIDADPRLAFAQHYAEQGYFTIAPDCVTAGERVTPGLKPYDTKGIYRDQPGVSALGRMLFDHIRALDVLADIKQVDSARLGVIGHGLGGVNALLAAAFDDRAQACVASSAFIRFADDPDPVARWASEDSFIYLPKVREAAETGEFPFDWEHILALAAPSAVLLNTPLNDPAFPKPASCRKAVTEVKKIYKLLGAPDAVENHTHRDGPGFSRASLQIADEWLERWL